MALVVAAVLAVLVFTNLGKVQGAALATPGPPSQGSTGYDCGVPAVGPLCQGVSTWVGGFEGARTSVTVSAASPGDGCVYTEEWLYEVGPEVGIQAGYRVCQGMGYADWFWGEEKPGSGKSDLGDSRPLLRSDLGWPATIDIHRIGPQAFVILIMAHSGTVLTAVSSGYVLHPTKIEIGTTLSGSHGARQVATPFRDNQYQAAGQRSWSYETQDVVAGRQPVDGPVFARWEGLPPSSSQRGGVLVTCVGQTC
ncbi:MAG: hypothetical protein J2P45_23780 [Candidatus Dormibacteraeota bacterium]|nr:hypothetical protein [Candidatus Dormibacteraeota bacterium]